MTTPDVQTLGGNRAQQKRESEQSDFALTGGSRHGARLKRVIVSLACRELIPRRCAQWLVRRLGLHDA